MSAQIRLHEGRPERLLVIVAHPDDAELAVGGSIARWTGEGTTARLVCVTSGDAGSSDLTADPLELAARREAEQLAAAAIVGYDEVVFLHRPDGAVANDLALREQLVRLIRRFRPDAVATADPSAIVHEDGTIQHVDHRETGAAAIDAVHPAAHNAMSFPHLVRSEELEPHRVTSLYLFSVAQPRDVVDIRDTIDIKCQAVRAHASQAPDPDDVERLVRAAASQTGALVDVSAGEAYSITDIG